MSHDDHNRSSDPRDRGAYTPPTDDDLPFNRGGFDPRRAPAAKSPPVTLIISAVVLLLLIVAVVIFYRSGLRSSTDAPPAVGTPVGEMKAPAPIEAQPIDPEAGVNVYRDEAQSPDVAPTYAAPPEAALPRPAPQPLPPVTSTELPPARPASPPSLIPPAPAQRPAAVAPPAKAPVAAPAPTPATPAAPVAASGSSAVQIGAFSSTAIADREYASTASRFPQFARGAEKRVQEVTASNGSTVYRTTFTGLSRERAQAFCAAIKSGGGDCLVR